MRIGVGGKVCAAAVLVAALAGCSKDAEVVSVMSDIDSFTNELVRRVEGAADTAAGVADAQRYLEEKRGHLKERIQSVKTVKNFQITEATKAKLVETAKRNSMAVASMKLKYVSRAAQDAAFRASLDKLTDDYIAILKM